MWQKVCCNYKAITVYHNSEKYSHLPPETHSLPDHVTLNTISETNRPHSTTSGTIICRHLHNSTSLVRILQDLHVPDEAIHSLDVTSLYPSIPQSQCLDVIYQEMHNHPDLLALDPNFIVQLLHLNMNYIYYIYFEFSNLIFQQIKGTAMGAAFSPSIANIYMSTIVNDFLQTQDVIYKVHRRHIHDMDKHTRRSRYSIQYTQILNSLMSSQPSQSTFLI